MAQGLFHLFKIRAVVWRRPASFFNEDEIFEFPGSIPQQTTAQRFLKPSEYFPLRNVLAQVFQSDPNVLLITR